MRTAAITPTTKAEVTSPSLPPPDREALDAAGTTKEMFCPRCEAPGLREQLRDGVSIDVCGKCHGIWLDCGELERLIAQAIHGSHQCPRPLLRHLSAQEYAELFWDEA